jgi:hypothetical protein
MPMLPKEHKTQRFDLSSLRFIFVSISSLKKELWATEVVLFGKLGLSKMSLNA